MKFNAMVILWNLVQMNKLDAIYNAVDALAKLDCFDIINNLLIQNKNRSYF